eukprot:m.306430 g.306430  ORF g.306430 m.306430 type:complete len:211 (+) comp41228_c0_seq1:105-737(+)
MATRFKMSEGDWLCPDAKCGNVNFARRDKCNRCDADKPNQSNEDKLSGGHEIGKAAAEKSGGLFSSNDWQCKSCGNVNWARRSTCNICHAPRVVVEEKRTGLGGGYKENEDIEYVRRDDSDGEYDEFGRKKKKFRAKVPASSNELPTTVKEGEKNGKQLQLKDEEDDSEEEDMSKYDLADDDDDDDDDLFQHGKPSANWPVFQAPCIGFP